MVDDQIRGLAERLDAIVAEVQDIAESAENAWNETQERSWRGVQHKAEEALGTLSSAYAAAMQAEAQYPKRNSREWYLMFTDGDHNLFGLSGPIRGGQAEAERVMGVTLESDKTLAMATDWESPHVCAPYFGYHYVSVIELSPEEVKAMASIRRERA